MSRTKGVGDYVTGVDTDSEAAIVRLLESETGIPVLAEEAGGGWSETTWAVDPLDGTTNFMRGLPVVGVSVGLIEQGVPTLGVIVAPFMDLEFCGGRDLPVTANGLAVQPIRSKNPADWVVATGFPFRDKTRLPRYERVLHGALREFEDLRRTGAASLDLAWIATGSHDGFFELGLGTWDMAAGAALVLATGGRISDWDGSDNWLRTGNVLAGSRATHAALLELVRGAGSDLA